MAGVQERQESHRCPCLHLTACLAATPATPVSAPPVTLRHQHLRLVIRSCTLCFRASLHLHLLVCPRVCVSACMNVCLSSSLIFLPSFLFVFRFLFIQCIFCILFLHFFFHTLSYFSLSNKFAFLFLFFSVSTFIVLDFTSFFPIRDYGFPFSFPVYFVIIIFSS